jgi:Sin3 family co-repressor
VQQLSQQEKLATRPVSELDVTNWKRCTTSYVQLPQNYPELPCTGRRNNRMLAGLLNDEWVSVTSGSEDYSFKVGGTHPMLNRACPVHGALTTAALYVFIAGAWRACSAASYWFTL